MLRQINLKFGPSQSATPISLSLTPVTVFVGPNNSGKTRVLNEIFQLCQSGNENAGALVLKGAHLQPLDITEAERVIGSMYLGSRPGEQVNPGHRYYQAKDSRFQLPTDRFLQALINPDAHRPEACQWFLRFHTVMLDGPNRISLVNQVPAGDLQQPGHNSMQVLFRQDSLRHSLRERLLDAFGVHFTIDPTQVGQLRAKFSDYPPPSDDIERGWTAASVEYHGKARDIQEFSDGVKAFSGILMGVLGGNPYAILIDEPEAFLHPALAFKLGRNIAEITAGSNKRVFVATHSPDFLMGCIQSGAPINIVRLTYRSGVATARVLPSAKLLTLMRNPLLRSTGVLGGIFYEHVVVSEADADRAFYHEINARLNALTPSEGIPNALFVNAQNRQTVDQIIKPLRELGIPAAAAIDIDVIKEGGTVFSRLLEAAFVPPIDQRSLAAARSALKGAFDATGKDMTFDGGIQLLNSDEVEAARNFITQLAQYGIFVVPNGALESWLPNLGAGVAKSFWLTTVFERMGEDPTSANYLRPSDGDVWDFVRGIARWLSDSNRKGIPPT